MTDSQKQPTLAPGPPNTDGAFQQALLRVGELETQNTKLYEDNRRLAAAVHMLRERHAFLSKPQAAQLQQLMYLQELVRNIEADRLRATRQHQDLLNSLTNGTSPQLLAAQLQQSRAEYTHLLKDYNHLLDKHTRLKVHLSMTNPLHHIPVGVPVPVVPSSHGGSPAATFPRPDIPMLGDPPCDVLPSHSPLTSPTRPHRNFPLPQQAIQSHERPSLDGFIQRQPPTVHSQHPPPTPPSSASMAAPAGPPLHTPQRPVTRHPAKPPVHMPQWHAGPRIMSAPATLPQGHHPFPQGPKPARGTHGLDQTKAKSLPDAIPRPVQSQSASMSPSSVKRSSSALGSPASPEVDAKRSRVEGFDKSTPDKQVTNGFPLRDQGCEPETDSADITEQVKVPHPEAPSVSPSAVVDQTEAQPTPLGDKDLRPDEECVRMIFEKDADIENGVFCDPCLSRYEAGMLLEPPDILVNPDPDFLLKHCITIHPTLWDDLRHRRDLTEK
ncbi:hypothetical protein F5J12DRAFT_790692 [Pisolithus orientalis]|uniref:uncharacterized protein n=1 Tax=Pisolithus orientalis TaxID=936130 RepID=UPI002225A975|nr:uncharacterized protein F5J12DRAFT_790692 [Pisolithus orientalis]KAI6035045.1 hypothetical protein F5J12DRAFT_790692 [Pisolithus orientalis]